MSKSLIAIGIVAAWLVTAGLFKKGMTDSFSADDYGHVNKNIHFENWKSTLAIFFELDGREYRPLVRLSLWLNYLMTGTSAVSFHLTNLLLHCGNILCVYFIAVIFFQNSMQAYAGSLVFALHPIHTTNVNFIMGRTDLLCAIFYLCAVIFFSNYFFGQKGKRHYWISLACFIFAILSKEMAVSLPLLLFCAAMLFGKATGKATQFKLAILSTLPFWVIASTYTAGHLFFAWHNPQSIAVYTNFHWLNATKNILQAAFGLIYPFDLYWARNFYENRPILFMALGALAITALVIYWHRQNRILFIKDKIFLFSIVWFIVTLLPVIGGAALRWRLYLPSAGVSLLLIALYRSLSKEQGRYFALILAAFLILSATEIFRQSSIWRKQSQISKNFLDAAKRQRLDQLDEFYFANMPFGYKSAFLFSHHSIQEAFNLYFGRRPQIKILSYLNLSEAPAMEVIQGDGRLRFQIEPKPYDFFIFPPGRRVLASTGVVFRSDGYEVVVDTLAPSKMAVGYEVRIPPQSKVPFYFFDGHEIHRL